MGITTMIAYVFSSLHGLLHSRLQSLWFFWIWAFCWPFINVCRHQLPFKEVTGWLGQVYIFTMENYIRGTKITSFLTDLFFFSFFFFPDLLWLHVIEYKSRSNRHLELSLSVQLSDSNSFLKYTSKKSRLPDFP